MLSFPFCLVFPWKERGDAKAPDVLTAGIYETIFISFQDACNNHSVFLLPCPDPLHSLLSNHKELCDLTNGWLVRVWMITVFGRKGGKAEYLTSIFPMPIGKNLITRKNYFVPAQS